MKLEKQYKISIVVPVYNAEEYLKRCIDSVLEQTYENWELVLVDDGSTDASGDICDQYSKDNFKIITIHQKNQGVSVARNKGIDCACGDILMFLDADDWFTDDALEKAIVYWGKDTDLIIFDYYENGKQHLRFWEEKKLFYLSDPTVKKELIKNFTLKYNFISKNLGCTAIWAKAFCMDVVRQNDIRFVKGIRIAEDDVFLFYYIMNCSRKIKYINRAIYNYRWNEESAIFSCYQKPNLFQDICLWDKYITEMFHQAEFIELKGVCKLRRLKIVLWWAAEQQNSNLTKGLKYAVSTANDIRYFNCMKELHLFDKLLVLMCGGKITCGWIIRLVKLKKKIDLIFNKR